MSGIILKDFQNIKGLKKVINSLEKKLKDEAWQIRGSNHYDHPTWNDIWFDYNKIKELLGLKEKCLNCKKYKWCDPCFKERDKHW